MPMELDNSSTASGEASISSSGNQPPPPKSNAKKKRNLPGMPDPDAEVIALSPKALLATNRFVCEICNKGFQRDQNLQLHRRGHNLPWKLRQRTGKEVKKKVYVCPEPSCVHHHPTRALGDLTGIKKHFCRKHGEKKWKCDKCSKKYAVKSDWKAHFKICGTREYKCDCETVFSRRDSFITHRAFCDVLTKETAAGSPSPAAAENPNLESDPKVQPPGSSSPPPSAPPPPPAAAPIVPPPSTDAISSIQNKAMDSPENRPPQLGEPPIRIALSGSSGGSTTTIGSTNATVLASLFASSAASLSLQPPQPPAFSDLLRAMTRPDRPAEIAAPLVFEPLSLCLSTHNGSSLFGTGIQERRPYAPPPQPAMSATGLLQKAAQIGAAAASTSVFRGLGLSSSSSSAQQGSL
ncbi:protein indeterminate-domain 1-like [Momordica charantia]|uniref:Protein indeterminate-domain 1-like n=1 Tax=Momordica charantia TaxID=3673 RepID=A0A6J1C7K5_MOMCH|nr:protein indeterminate-domain 1-like [Momordica charantia]